MLRSSPQDAGKAATPGEPPRKLPDPRPAVLPLNPPAPQITVVPPGPAAPAAPQIAVVPPPAAPGLGAFLSGSAETRLRDLLAYAMAQEATGPLPPGEIDALRRRAEADLEAHAFRTLHNQLQTIRQEAVAEQAARLRPPLGFAATFAAGLLAAALAVAAAYALLRHGFVP